MENTTGYILDRLNDSITMMNMMNVSDFASTPNKSVIHHAPEKTDNCSVTLPPSSGGGHDVDKSWWPCDLRENYISHLYASYMMTEFVRKGTMVNCIIGIIFNMLNIICLSQLVKRSNYYIYLLSVAYGDLSNIIFNFSIGILRGSFPVIDQVFLDYPAVCTIHSFLIDFVCLVPVWFVAVVTGTKMMTLLFPFKTPVLTTKRRTYKILGVTLLIIFAWCCYKIPSGGFETSSAFGYKACRQITLPDLVFASTLLMSVIPAAVVLIMNIVILYKIRQSNKKREGMSVASPDEDSQKKQAHTTRLILMVATAFVIFVAPPRIFNLMTTMIEELPKYSFEQEVYWAKLGMDLRLVRQFGFVLYQLNFNTNFVLYMITDKHFQFALKRLLCPCRSKE